ncbi:hypothetical protein HZA57_01940 [Candidatus Poribacteria bacterium]|nr:hypothetical protein [Candidatus Poribacteria bacterium]
MDFREAAEYGRAFRSQVSEPGSSLVRQQDIAWCASRLLRLGQYLASSDPALRTLIEDCLMNLAEARPEPAIERLERDRVNHGHSPIYWALACHCSAHTLSEYLSTAGDDLPARLRGSLSEWCGAFRERLATLLTEPPTETGFDTLQCFLAQSAMFRDRAQFDWACQAALVWLQPANLGTGLAAETAAVVGGCLSGQGQEESRKQLIAALEAAAPANRDAAEARQALEDQPAVPSAEPSPYSLSRTVRKPGKPARGERRPGELINDFIGANTGLIIGGGILLLLGGCVLVFGLFADWMFNTSNVGNQSLSQWYETSKKRREEAKVVQAAPAPEQPAATGGAVVSAAAPGPPADPRGALPAVLDAHGKRLAAAAALPRVLPWQNGAGWQQVEQRGEVYLVTHQWLASEPPKAAVRFHMKWFAGDTPGGLQWVDAVYTWNSGAWTVQSAKRCLDQTDPAGNLIYAADASEGGWVSEALQAPGA